MQRNGWLATAALVAGMILTPAILPAQTHAHEGDGAMKDIVEVATEAGSFETLLAAVEAAGLVETLRGEGPFTVFAPTDAAFAELPAGALNALLADPDQLAAILTYHVVPGRVEASDLLEAGEAEPATVNGQTLAIRVTGSTVRVNDATVTTADVAASNGVIHVIDRVVLPRPAAATSR